MDHDWFLVGTDDLDLSFLQALQADVYDIPDEDDVVFKAHEASIRSDSVSPLVKAELRLSIQARRLSEGQDELKVDYPSVSSDDAKELSPNDVCRRERRKSQNRASAQKYRSKKKHEERNLKKKLECLRSENSDLQSEVSKLLGEVHLMKEAITQHLQYCLISPLTEGAGQT